MSQLDLEEFIAKTRPITEKAITDACQTGRAYERARIVAFLRASALRTIDSGEDDYDAVYRDVRRTALALHADAIERGEHDAP